METVFASRRLTSICFLLIFLISACLRLGLVLSNRSANDDHVEVVQRILATHRLPQEPDCWECYQPKLFHASIAGVLQLMGLASMPVDDVILVAQLVNFGAGLLTCLVVGLFLYHSARASEVLKVLAFGLVALNPALIGINSQATNDSLAILFATMALFCIYRFLPTRSIWGLALAFVFVSLGISAKANVWVVVIAIVVALLVKGWIGGQPASRTALTLLLFGASVLVVSILNPLNQYASNYRRFGSPLMLPIARQPLPPLFQQDAPALVDGPGILSVQDGFFTFKFFDLLNHPRNEAGRLNFRPTRTSLWTQLYAQAHSLHFWNWPPSWMTPGDQAFGLSRAAFVLALLPTALLLLGLVQETLRLWQAILRRQADAAAATYLGLTAPTFMGFLLFICLYVAEFRDYPTMKVIFIFPALITFPLLFMEGANSLLVLGRGRFHWAAAAATAGICALLVLSIIDVITITQLIYERTYGL